MNNNVAENNNVNNNENNGGKNDAKKAKRTVNDFNEVTRQARVIYNKLKRIGCLHWEVAGLGSDADLKKKAVMQVLYNLRDEKYSRNNYMKDLRLRMNLLICNHYFQDWLDSYGIGKYAKAIAMNIAFEGTSKIESMLMKEVLQSGGFITTEPQNDWLTPIFTDEEIAGKFYSEEKFAYKPAIEALKTLGHVEEEQLQE